VYVRMTHALVHSCRAHVVVLMWLYVSAYVVVLMWLYVSVRDSSESNNSSNLVSLGMCMFA